MLFLISDTNSNRLYKNEAQSGNSGTVTHTTVQSKNCNMKTHSYRAIFFYWFIRENLKQIISNSFLHTTTKEVCFKVNLRR